MKTFAYTFRDPSGALKKGSIVAIDRVDALRQIKAMGFVAVNLSEGKAGVPTRASLFPAGKGRLLWLAVAGVVVILLAALAVWRTSERKHRVKRSAPAAATAKKAAPAAARPAKPGSPKTGPAKTPTSAPRPAPAIPVTETPQPHATPPPATAAAQPAPQPAPQPAEQVVEQKPQHPEQFKTTTEQLLGLAMSLPPGMPVPPMPITQNLDMDFVNSLTNEIVIFDDDDEHTANVKENVAAAKNQLLKLVEEGRGVTEVLQEYEKDTNERAEAHSEAQMELSRLYRSGRADEAKAYMEKVNKAFDEMGIDPIALPRSRPNAAPKK